MTIDSAIFSAVQQVSSVVSNGISNPIKSISDLTNSIPSFSTVANKIPGFSGISDAVSSNFDKHTLLGMQSRSDPILSFMWFCVVKPVMGVSLPWYYIEEFTAPFRSFDVQTQYREGKVFHFAGQHSISNLSLRFYDDTTGKVGSYLDAWRRAVFNPTTGPSGFRGQYNYPAQYKKDITLVVLDVTKFGQVYTFTYKGCWPTTADPLNLTSGSSDRITPAQEFACDEVEIAIKNFPPMSLIGILKDGMGSFQGSGLNLFGNGSDAVDSAFTSLQTQVTNAVGTLVGQVTASLPFNPLAGFKFS